MDLPVVKEALPGARYTRDETRPLKGGAATGSGEPEQLSGAACPSSLPGVRRLSRWPAGGAGAQRLVSWF